MVQDPLVMTALHALLAWLEPSPRPMVLRALLVVSVQAFREKYACTFTLNGHNPISLTFPPSSTTDKLLAGSLRRASHAKSAFQVKGTCTS